MEDIEIYYISGTGNSLFIAKELQKRIPGTKLIPIVKFLEKADIKTESKTIGFIFPVYIMSIPVQVKDFIKKLDIKSAKHIFAIPVRNTTASVADKIINKMLEKKGKRLDYYFILKMAMNSPTGLMPEFLPGFHKKVESWEKIITADHVSEMEKTFPVRLDQIAKQIVNKKKHIEKESIGFLNSLLMTALEKMTENRKTEIDFYADECCNGCGLCEKVCLSKKIRMADKSPVWQKDVHCYFCYSCFNTCPIQSILVKNKYDRKNGRYIHPGITPSDLAEQK